MTNIPESNLCCTPLHRQHLALGAKMVPFAGYELPVQYHTGIIGEHLHTRKSAGLFDVSHMGQMLLWPNSGNPADAALELEKLVPADIAGLRDGRQRYGLFTDAGGGILDDFIVARRGNHFLLIVNASRKAQDFDRLQDYVGQCCRLQMLEDRALIALQGPESGSVLEKLVPGSANLNFMESREFMFQGSALWISRSGYTGEDGFEISVPADVSEGLFSDLLEQKAVQPAGLGSRDSLRLEAGLCLHGSDIDDSTSPVEAALEWAIPGVRRIGGRRAGGFPGDARVLSELADGAGRRRVGIRPEGKAPMRHGTVVHADQEGRRRIGLVTSGGYGPSVGGPVSMGYVEIEFAISGTLVFCEVRGRMLPAKVHSMPFIEHRYNRMRRPDREVH